MSEATILRKQVKKIVDNASEKELELMYYFFEATAKTDWRNEITSDHERVIDIGLQQLNNGEGTPHKEVMKKYSKWLKK